MTEKIQGLVISVVKHSDRYNVVTLFTRTHGRLAFLSPATTRAKSKGRNARLALLSLVECDVRLKGGEELSLLPAVNTPHIWKSLYFNPIKGAMTIFLSEFLNKLLRAAAPDTELWDYIYNSIFLLDSLKKNLANFHIAFLIGLSHYMGIAPLIDTYKPDYYFDLRAGQFTPFRPLHSDWLNLSKSQGLRTLMRMNYANMHRFRLSGEGRSLILSEILRYYSLHLPGSANLNSPEILSELFK